MNESNEHWLPVPGYEGLYEVSNRGRVWSAPRATTRGGLLSLVNDGRGYKHVTLTRNGKQRHYPVHQLVLLAFAGSCPEGQEVRHLDDNPAHNFWPENLIYGTHAENMEDMVRLGNHYEASMTCCPEDHEYTPENTRIGSKGERICRACSREYQRKYQREYQRRRRAEGKALMADLSPEKQERKRAYNREYQRCRRAEQKRPRVDLPELY